MRRRPPRSTRTDTLFPYTTLFRSRDLIVAPAKYPVHCLANGDPVAPEAVPTRLKRIETNFPGPQTDGRAPCSRSEEHTSELQSLMRISYAVFCLKKKITRKNA